MSRADDLKARQQAELAVVSLEEELIAAKESGTDRGDLVEVKERLREARRVYREMTAPEPAEGDAVAHPETVNTSARALGIGGGDQ